jgi:hypothetical protein
MCESLLAGADSPDRPNSPWVRAYLHGVMGRCLADVGQTERAIRQLEVALDLAEAWGIRRVIFASACCAWVRRYLRLLASKKGPRRGGRDCPRAEP